MTGPADVPVYCCDECGTLYPGDIQLRLMRKPNHQILAENERLWDLLEDALEHIGTGHAHIAGELLRDALRARKGRL